MVQIQNTLVEGVKTFLDSGDRSFLDTMQGLDRNSIEAQATIRYLMQLKHWPLTPDSDFAGLLDRFFGEYPERTKMDAETYRQTTFDMIKSAWQYECIVVLPEPKAEAEDMPKKPARGKAAKKSHMVKDDEGEEGETGSKTFKSIREQEAEA